MARTDEATRRAGALAAVAAAAALLLALFPAPVAVGHWYVVLVLALFVAFLLGCAAVVLSLEHRAVAQAAEAAREILAVPWRAETGLRWVGFAGMVFYAVCLVSRPPPLSAAAKEEVSVDKVNAILLFLVFLAGVLAVNLSMLTGRGSEPTPPPPPAAAAPEEQLDGGEVNVMLPSCGVSMIQR